MVRELLFVAGVVLVSIGLPNFLVNMKTLPVVPRLEPARYIVADVTDGDSPSQHGRATYQSGDLGNSTLKEDIKSTFRDMDVHGIEISPAEIKPVFQPSPAIGVKLDQHNGVITNQNGFISFAFHKYIVHWTMDEPCTNCSYYACTDGSYVDQFFIKTSCPPPTVKVDHFKMFEDDRVAIRFINHESDSILSIGGNGMLFDTNKLPDKAENIELFDAANMNIAQEKVGEEDVEETRVVKVKKDKLKWVVK